MISRLPIVVLVAGLLLAVLPGRSVAQWKWLNPTPHGNRLFDVEFLTDNTAIAVGSAGTIMVTHDAGLSWTTSFRTNGEDGGFEKVARVDDTTAVVVGNYPGYILRTSDSGQSWVSVAPLIDTFSALTFSGNVGIATGNRTEIRSTDGGLTWNQVVGAPYVIHGVDLVTPMIGYCKMEFSILKTLDGGLTWTDIPGAPFVPGYLASPVSFADEMNGVVPTGGLVAGSGPRLFVTHDGGASWVERFLGSGESGARWNINDIEFVSPSTIVAAVEMQSCDLYTAGCISSGQFYLSTNDGVTWAHESTPRILRGVAINSAGVALAVGDEGGLYRRDASGTWTQRGGPTWYGPLDDDGRLAFRNPDVGVVLGTRTDDPDDPYDQTVNTVVVMRTSTGGSSWDPSYSNVVIKDLAYLPGSSDLYAIATQTSGAITSTLLMRSTDNGQTWTNASSLASDLRLTALEFSSPAHGVAVGSAGQALVIDFSPHFSVAPVTIRTGVREVAFADASTGVAVGGTTSFGDGFVLRSVNGGTTWSQVYSGFPRLLTDVDFASPTVCVAVGSNGLSGAGYIIRSTNGGTSWESVFAYPSQRLNGVSIDPGGYGLAVSGFSVYADGTLLETTDGGATWSVIQSPTTLPLTDVMVLAPYRAIVCGSDLTVLEYRQNTVPTLIRSLDVAASPFGADLRWDVVTDANLSGFSITRSSGNDRETIVRDLTATSRSYRDQDVVPGGTYEYQLLAVDRDGSYTQSAPVTVTIPAARIELLPNQPNPFNPTTTISFVVPARMPVVLTIHDVAGRVVATLTDNVRDAGRHSITWNANGVASGVYFAKLRAGKSEVSRKLVLIK